MLVNRRFKIVRGVQCFEMILIPSKSKDDILNSSYKQ